MILFYLWVRESPVTCFCPYLVLGYNVSVSSESLLRGVKPPPEHHARGLPPALVNTFLQWLPCPGPLFSFLQLRLPSQAGSMYYCLRSINPSVGPHSVRCCSLIMQIHANSPRVSPHRRRRPLSELLPSEEN